MRVDVRGMVSYSDTGCPKSHNNISFLSYIQNFYLIFNIFLGRCYKTLGDSISWLSHPKNGPKIVELYHETKSIISTQRKYRYHFKCKDAPIYRTIVRLVETFKDTGNVNDKPRSGRKRLRCDKSIEMVRESVGKSPRTSIRKHGQEVSLKRMTTWRIMSDDLKLYLYKIGIKQSINSQATEVN